MSYTTQYIDENDKVKTATITEDESVEAMSNDYEEISRKYDPKYVKIERVRAQAGEAMHVKVTVFAPTHYLTASTDITPKSCDSMSVDIICYLGYPLKAVSATYAEDRYLASPNVFSSGHACIDTWIPFTSSLVTVVEKLVHDMIHDPCVTRYDSPANSKLNRWHSDHVAAGHFPTIQPKLLYAPEVRPLPPRRTEAPQQTPAQQTTAPRPLPPRRH